MLSLLQPPQALGGMTLQQPRLLCCPHAPIQSFVPLATKINTLAALELLDNRTARLKVTLLAAVVLLVLVMELVAPASRDPDHLCNPV